MRTPNAPNPYGGWVARINGMVVGGGSPWVVQAWGTITFTRVDGQPDNCGNVTPDAHPCNPEPSNYQPDDPILPFGNPAPDQPNNPNSGCPVTINR